MITLKKTSTIPVLICGIIAILIFQQKIPLFIGSVLIFLVTTILGITYKKNDKYEYGYWGASISLFLFIIGGFLLGFDNIFPNMGIFFYIGYSISLLIRMLIYYPLNYNKKGKYLIGINTAAYLSAALISYLLFPSALYLIIPGFLVIVSSVLTGIFLEKIYLVEKETTWSFKLPVVILLPVILLGIYFIVLVPDNKEIDLSANEIIEINQLIDKVETFNLLEEHLDIGRWYFEKNMIVESEQWFLKVQEIWPEEVISLGYLAAILGIKSGNAKNPNTKMRYAQESMEQMDNLVEKYPENLEVRFIRAMFYSQLPSVFRRESYVFTDLEYILLKEPGDNTYFILAYNFLTTITGGEYILNKTIIDERARLKGLDINNKISVAK